MTVDPIEDFFAGYPSDVQTICRLLRVMVNQAMPEANEILYASQNHVGYSFTHSSNDKICYICPLQNYVRLGFMFGANLPDPENMLVGDGKRLRHIKIYTLDAANNPALEALVTASWTDAQTHMKKKS